MKNKTILIFLLFFGISNCGYNPIYSSKNSNFNITKIELVSKNKITTMIKNNIKNYSNSDSSNKFHLKFNSKKNESVSSKDSKGNPKILTMNILVEVEIIENNLLKSKKNFSETFSYSNNDNKFDLAQYKTNIEKILTNKIIENIITYLFTF